MLIVSNINKTVGAPVQTHILKGISFSMSAGETVAITGPSGCGKTSFSQIALHLMTGMSKY